MSKNMWPDFEASTQATPRTILQRAGASLKDKTKGLVVFYVNGIKIVGEFATFRCSLFAPSIEYMYPFITVKFPIVDLYPAELTVDKVPSVKPAANEQELLDILGEVFRAPSTVDTIQKLMALT